MQCITCRPPLSMPEVGRRGERVISLVPVEKLQKAQPGPARGLYLGLAITILAVLAYGAYITMQFSGLRNLQDPTEPYTIFAWTPQFERIRTDLDDALRQEAATSEASPSSEQRRYL